MLFQIEFQQRDGFLFCRVEGETTVQSMEDLAARIRDECARAGVSGVVIDCDGMSGALDLGSLFRVGETYAAMLGGRIRVAGLNMPAQWRDNSFSEDVVRNRGGVLSHFSTLEEAAAWARGNG